MGLILALVLAAGAPPQGEMERCHRLIVAGQYEAARARLEPIVAEHPGWQRALFFLGLTYHEQQRHAEARPHFERALALDTTSADAVAIHRYYGWTLYYLGDAAAARREFDAYLAARPTDAEAHYALGMLAFDADDTDAAAERFATAIRLARAAGDARREGKAQARLGDVLTRVGRLDEARDALRRAVELRPDAYEAWFKLSRVLERLGDAPGAAEALAMHHKTRGLDRP